MRTFDHIVIGSDSGLDISSEAADRGLSVAVVEHGPFGGTCLNRGCIPSKILIHSADVMETIQPADLFGIKVEASSVDWDFIIKRASDTVDGDAQMVEEDNRRHPKIAVYEDTARFVGEKVLEVGDERTSQRRSSSPQGPGPSCRRSMDWPKSPTSPPTRRSAYPSSRAG